MRVGWGFDSHVFGGPGPLVLAGVAVDSSLGVVATSDGDVVAHALADALLGAAAAGDLGDWFPSSDPASEGADSMAMLRRVVDVVQDAGYTPASVDVTVVAEAVRIAPHREAMRNGLARTLGLPMEAVSVKATTTDGLGFVGRGEGLAAMAAAIVEETS